MELRRPTPTNRKPTPLEISPVANHYFFSDFLGDLLVSQPPPSGPSLG